MELSFLTFLIVCPLVFLAGFVDSIGGGGGLVSLPAYLLAGLPPQMASATNKMSATLGTVVSTARYIKHRQADLLLALPGIAASLLGAQIGARLALTVDPQVFKILLVCVLPAVAWFVLRKKKGPASDRPPLPRKRQMLIVAAFSLVIGGYDGFYGPGTGTFLILAYTALARVDALVAGGNSKLTNLASNVSSLTLFLLRGKVLIPLGLAASVFSIAGHYVGAGLAIRKGGGIVRVIILAVLLLLAANVLYELIR